MIKKMLDFLESRRRLLRFVSFKTLGRALQMFTPLLLSYYFTPDQMGKFSLFKMILFLGINIFVGPALSPLNVESNKEYSDKNMSNITFTSGLIYLVISIVFFFITFLLFGKKLVSFAGLDYSQYGQVYIFSFLGLLIFRLLSILFMSQNKRKMHSFVEFVYPMLYNSLLILSLSSNFFDLKFVFISYLIAGIIILLCFLPFLDFGRVLPLDFSWENFKKFSGFTFWCLVGAMGSYLLNWGHNLILKNTVSLSEIGIYNLAFQIFKGGIMVGGMFAVYYTPLISQKISERKTIEIYLNKTRPKLVRLALVVTIVGIVVVGPITTIFLDSKYYGIIRYLRYLAVANFLNFYLVFYYPILNALEMYKITNLLFVGQASVGVLLTSLLAGHYGIMGAVISTLFSYLCLGVVTFVLFKVRILRQLAIH